MVLIQNIEVLDVEEGKEEAFEAHGRSFSLKKTTFTPNFVHSSFVPVTYITQVIDPVNFSNDKQIAMILANIWRCKSIHVSSAVFGCDKKIYYVERFKKTFDSWISDMCSNLPQANKWFAGAKKRLNFVFNRLGMGFHLIHRNCVAFNSFDHDLIFTSAKIFKFLTLTDATNAENFYRMDLIFFIKLYLSCVFYPLVKAGRDLDQLLNDPTEVAEQLGLDNEVLSFINLAKVALENKKFPGDLIFGHPMFYGVREKMKYHETLCTEFLGDRRDDTIDQINDEFFYWRDLVSHKEVKKTMWFVLRDRMKRAGLKDFGKFREANKYFYLFRDFVMLYYNTKKHMDRVVGEEGAVTTTIRLKDDQIYHLVDEQLGGGTVTEIHGRLVRFWLNDPARMQQLLMMMTFF